MKRILLIAMTSVLFSTHAVAQKRPASRAPVRPAAATPGTRAALPDFTFKDARAGEVMDPTAVGRCTPSSDGIAGKVECTGKDRVVAGITLLLAPTYYFYDNRLTGMLFLFDAKGTQFLTFLGAFRERYGAPCKTEIKKWQNRAGSTFDNSTATWCFRTGRLTIEQLGPSLEYGTVTYDDEMSAPSKATPKDF